MHMLLRILVPAKNKENARIRAGEIVNDLVRNGEFDYGVFFNEDLPLAGKNRWGSLPVAVPYNSRLGKRLIKQGIRFTWKEFYDGYKNLKRCLRKYTARELFEGKILSKRNSIKKVMEKITNEKNDDLFMFDLWLWQLLRERYSYFVVGFNFGPIRNNTELKNLFEAIELSKGEKWWVVPVDVHY